MRKIKFIFLLLFPLFATAQFDTTFNSAFFWDTVNHRLGIGTTSPGFDTTFFDLKDFGYVGNGIASFNQDTTALGLANRTLKLTPGQKKLTIPATDSFLAFAGTGLIPVDSTYYQGNGTRIRNVNTDAGNGFRGAIFVPCTYSMVFGEEITHDTACSYVIRNADVGKNYIIIKKLTDRDSLKVGMLVAVAGRKCYRGGDPGFPYFSQLQLSIIKSFSGDTVFLNDNLLMNFTRYPVIIDVNSPKNTLYYGNIHNQISRNVTFDGFIFEQAPTNELDTLPLTHQVGAALHGGGYMLEIKNCKFDCYSAISGNLYQKAKIINNDITAAKKYFDMGCNSVGDSIINTAFHFKDSPVRDLDSDNSFMYMDEGNCFNVFDGLTARGDWNQLSLIRIGNSAHDLTFKNWDINFPLYDTGIVFYLKDGSPDAIHVKNILFDSVNLKIKSTYHFVSCIGDSVNATKNRGVWFKNSDWSGELLTDKAFFIKNFRGVRKQNVYINGIKQ